MSTTHDQRASQSGQPDGPVVIHGSRETHKAVFSSPPVVTKTREGSDPLPPMQDTETVSTHQDLRTVQTRQESMVKVGFATIAPESAFDRQYNPVEQKASKHKLYRKFVGSKQKDKDKAAAAELSKKKTERATANMPGFKKETVYMLASGTHFSNPAEKEVIETKRELGVALTEQEEKDAPDLMDDTKQAEEKAAFEKAQRDMFLHVHHSDNMIAMKVLIDNDIGKVLDREGALERPDYFGVERKERMKQFRDGGEGIDAMVSQDVANLMKNLTLDQFLAGEYYELNEPVLSMSKSRELLLMQMNSVNASLKYRAKALEGKLGAIDQAIRDKEGKIPAGEMEELRKLRKETADRHAIAKADLDRAENFFLSTKNLITIVAPVHARRICELKSVRLARQVIQDDPEAGVYKDKLLEELAAREQQISRSIEEDPMDTYMRSSSTGEVAISEHEKELYPQLAALYDQIKSLNGDPASDDQAIDLMHQVETTLRNFFTTPLDS